jgi:hypothetical protein
VDEMIVLASEIALRPLDLDDAGAGIGKVARTQRRRNGLLQRHDENA